ncbi:Protein of unknown function [Pyronema omphalodes CBS 100304]|uniref:Uncharacterized protein n=1 Tax=Pyronema omphalodes (strain CBS 100304) TaxID=1076935 RepID=U4LFN5_PYROM|nr:Protein of unknown function [Pyronema omphalodes CBS 100304]
MWGMKLTTHAHIVYFCEGNKVFVMILVRSIVKVEKAHYRLLSTAPQRHLIAPRAPRDPTSRRRTVE